MICGGAEAAICPLGISGFSAARALCNTFNSEPVKGSRPWAKIDLVSLWERVLY